MATRLSAAARRDVIERAATEVFAEHGYAGASMDEIARRSGVTAPVVYDHFDSKQALHRRLLERHFAELRAIWREHTARDVPLERRLEQAVDAWLAYVESHPFAWRMLFRDTTGDPEVQAAHAEVAAQSRDLLLPLWAEQLGATGVEMTWEVFRAVLQGLALWWLEHQDVPREQVLATIMNTVWIGFERVTAGERWSPPGGA
ncbi:MAG: TetR/AcrR family transcriptional regulator [Gaiellaceae bacterium]